MQSITPPPTRPDADPNEVERQELHTRMVRGVHWFYWIAALSFVNTIITVVGGNFSFAVGLAFTQIVDVLARELGGAAAAVVIVVDLICVGVFVVFGIIGSRGQSWAILTGIVLYVLDGLLLLGLMVAAQQMLILGLAIHVLATYQLIAGFIASRKLAQLRPNPGPPGPEIISTMGQNP